MIIGSKEEQKKLKKPITVFFTLLCIVFWIITANTLRLDDKRVFILFSIGISLFTLCWLLVYRFYVSKL